MSKKDTDKNSAEYREKKWSKINFWSCFAAVIVAGIDLIFSIVSQYVSIKVSALLAMVITVSVIGLAAVIIMIVSWYKLRSFKKRSEQEADKTDGVSDGN